MQTNTEQKNRQIRHVSAIVVVLCGTIVFIVTVIDGELRLSRLLLATGMILVGLLNILPCPAIVKVIGACIAIFGGAFAVGYYLMRLILG